jgi:hypothetical protein
LGGRHTAFRRGRGCASLLGSRNVCTDVGRTIWRNSIPLPLSAGVLPGSPHTARLRIPSDELRCGQGGPFLALATVGPYSARRWLPGWKIGFPRAPERVNRLRAKYIAGVDAICTAATARFRAVPPKLDGTELEQISAWSETAARASEEALAELRALPPPKADRGRVNPILSFMEQQTDVLHQVASAGGTARVRTLGEERIHLTHQKDGLVYRLASLWGVSPEALYRCPVSLSA